MRRPLLPGEVELGSVDAREPAMLSCYPRGRCHKSYAAICCICMCVPTYIYVYIHTHIHAYIHRYIHTTCMCSVYIEASFFLRLGISSGTYGLPAFWSLDGCYGTVLPYIYMYVCMYVCIVCMYVCRYVCKHKPGRDLFVLYDFGAALAGWF